MKRHKMSSRTSKRVFRNNTGIHRRNTKPRSYRGGARL